MEWWGAAPIIQIWVGFCLCWTYLWAFVSKVNVGRSKSSLGALVCPQRRVICSACVCAGVWAPAKPLPSVQGCPEADGLHAGPPRGLPGAERGRGGVRGPDGDHVQRAAQQQLPGFGQRGERLAGKQPRGCPKLGSALAALKSVPTRPGSTWSGCPCPAASCGMWARR